MDREIEIIHALKASGYMGRSCVKKCRCDELPCPLLTWLVSELKITCPELQDRKMGVVLVGELKALLTDLHCPLTFLNESTLSPLLLNKVIEFLVSELNAATILKYKEAHPEDKNTADEAGRERRLEDYNIEQTMKWCQQFEAGDQADERVRREETERELSLLFQTLDLDSASHLKDVGHQVELRLAQLPVGKIMEPLLNVSLTPEQWREVEKINEVLLVDYECRSQMMTKRFQVTLQSFAWGEKEKERSQALASVLPLSSMSLSSKVSIPLLLAARKDQSWILPVKAGPSTAIHKVLMGTVPDRGGRPGEIEPPMPSWEGRREGGRGSGRGGRHQQQRNFPGKKKNKKKD